MSAPKRKRMLTAEERAEALEELRDWWGVKCWRCECVIDAELDVSCGCVCHDSYRQIHHLPRPLVA